MHALVVTPTEVQAARSSGRNEIDLFPGILAYICGQILTLDSLFSALQVLSLVAGMEAVAARFDGIVTSPLEAAAVRRIAGPEAILVTPGVRSAGRARGDQKRVATPAEAIRNGANYLVSNTTASGTVSPLALVVTVTMGAVTVSSRRSASNVEVVVLPSASVTEFTSP